MLGVTYRYTDADNFWNVYAKFTPPIYGLPEEVDLGLTSRVGSEWAATRGTTLHETRHKASDRSLELFLEEHYPEEEEMPKHPEVVTRAMVDAIIDILIETCGVHSSLKEDLTFINDLLEGTCSEYRIGGWLGFGGKFHDRQGRWSVSCYREDEDPLVLYRMAHAQARLNELAYAARVMV